MSLRVTPIFVEEANEFVRIHHRHHRPVLRAIFAVAVSDEDNQVRGVALVTRPSSRELQDGYTAEVRRLATDGAKNACSMLYAACWRASRAIGYLRLVTYILESEPGTSLRAAGWREVARTSGRSWDTPGVGRPRVDWHPTLTTGEDRVRWEAL